MLPISEYLFFLYLTTLSIPFSLSSSEIPVVCRLTHYILSHKSHILFLFFKFVFHSLFLLGDFHYSLFQFTYSFFCNIQFTLLLLAYCFSS